MTQDIALHNAKNQNPKFNLVLHLFVAKRLFYVHFLLLQLIVSRLINLYFVIFQLIQISYVLVVFFIENCLFSLLAVKL